MDRFSVHLVHMDRLIAAQCGHAPATHQQGSASLGSIAGMDVPLDEQRNRAGSQPNGAALDANPGRMRGYPPRASRQTFNPPANTTLIAFQQRLGSPRFAGVSRNPGALATALRLQLPSDVLVVFDRNQIVRERACRHGQFPNHRRNLASGFVQFGLGVATQQPHSSHIAKLEDPH